MWPTVCHDSWGPSLAEGTEFRAMSNMDRWRDAVLEGSSGSDQEEGGSMWAQAVLDDDDNGEDSAATPPQKWQDAVLDDSTAAQSRTAELLASTNEADSLREYTDDDSDSGQSPSQEDLSAPWWWAPRLRAAARSIKGQRLCASFPAKPLRIISCCTGASSESEVLKARNTCHA